MYLENVPGLAVCIGNLKGALVYGLSHAKHHVLIMRLDAKLANKAHFIKVNIIALRSILI